MSIPYYINTIIMNKVFFILLICGVLSTANFFSCQNKSNAPVIFKALIGSETGLNFNNKVTPTQDFNIFNYMYYYNGGGIGAGDFNNDGLIDVFFAANQGNNKIYLNRGKLHFEDITSKAGIPQLGSWCTGVSIVDINNDGLLDIYISTVGTIHHSDHRNQLLICIGIDSEGIPHYKEEAKQYGLDFQGYSTQAVFFDLDGDGDLDMFLLNHTVHETGTFGDRKTLSLKFNPLTGDRLYRNDQGHYTDITKTSGILSSVIGYGLGACVSDINLDGEPDLYIGNDFHENDYLYFNHHGVLKEELNDHIMHTSQFSMGVDVADINNDGYPEIISMDMMPYDNYILKRSEGEDEYDLFYEKLKYGYNFQYTRNNLQYNRRNGMFSEIGVFSGVFATDWSWSSLWMDFDNDGLKDLFISNGIPKRLNDIDYIHYVSDDAVQSKIRSNNLNQVDMSLIDKFPEIKIPNKFYHNQGSLHFEDIGDQVGNNMPTYSNGAVYADFDNDGKMDILVNNINDEAIVYHNIYSNTNGNSTSSSYVDITLKGSKQNVNALGAKIVLFTKRGTKGKGDIRTYEKYPVHGFMSSMEIPIHIGLEKTTLDSAFLIWPDNTFQRINLNHSSHSISFTYRSGLPNFNYNKITNYKPNNTPLLKDITQETGINFVHHENDFQEFNREQLIPHMVSTEGPALAIGDINHDGFDDIFIGGSKLTKSALFIQQTSGKFIRSPQPDLDLDSTYEDVGASWVDINRDGFIDLIIASGGNEFYGQDEHLTPRVYLNDGHSHLKRLNNAFKNIFLNASEVAPYDFNTDGFTDLFIGGRSVPYEYGLLPRSYIFKNDGTGKFVDVTASLAPELSKVGMVTSALWFDIDQDGDQDLLISLEWGEIVAFMNEHGHFIKKILSDQKGWWNFILPVDLDHNGKIDLIVGNLGLNNRLKDASKVNPIRLYYNDFDDNGKKEQILTYYLNGKEIPFANLGELEKQMPSLKKRFLYAGDFAKASLKEIFDPSKLEHSEVLEANYLSNAVLMNQGNLRFITKALPLEAQFSPLKDAVVIDANGDSLPDILLMGNFYENNIQMGRYDSDFGTILVNKGKGNFQVENLNGMIVKGQVRHIKPIKIGKKNAFILAKNNDSLKIIQFKEK